MWGTQRCERWLTIGGIAQYGERVSTGGTFGGEVEGTETAVGARSFQGRGTYFDSGEWGIHYEGWADGSAKDESGMGEMGSDG